MVRLKYNQSNKNPLILLLLLLLSKEGIITHIIILNIGLHQLSGKMYGLVNHLSSDLKFLYLYNYGKVIATGLYAKVVRISSWPKTISFLSVVLCSYVWLWDIYSSLLINRFLFGLIWRIVQLVPNQFKNQLFIPSILCCKS